MSVMTTDLDAALAAAAAAIRTLPAPDLATSDAVEGTAALEHAASNPESKAVMAFLEGSVTGQIVLILMPSLAEQVENGPLGPQELVAGLDPALADATKALSKAFGNVRYEVAQSISAEVALSNAGTYESITVVPFLSEGVAAGFLVILINHPAPVAEPSPDAASFETLAGVPTGTVVIRGVELLSDVEMGVTAELGRTRMTVRELLSLQPGSIVELDRAAGSPVDLLVNGTLVARGEVVVIDEEFGVRITEIIGYDSKGK